MENTVLLSASTNLHIHSIFWNCMLTEGELTHFVRICWIISQRNYGTWSIFP